MIEFRSIAVAALFSLLLILSRQPCTAQSQPPAQQTEVIQQSPPPRELTPREKEEQTGDLHMARKRYSEAVEVYLGILKREPRNAKLMNKVGIAYYQQGNLEQAKRFYERASKTDKTWASPVNNLATIFYTRKNYKKATSLYRKAIGIREDVAAFHRNLGNAYFALKKYEDAMGSFVRALQIDPQIFEQRSGVGTILQQGSIEDRATFYFLLAKIYAQIGDVERCAHYLTRARDANYKELNSAETDPAFAAVIKDPLIQRALRPESASTAVPPANP